MRRRFQRRAGNGGQKARRTGENAKQPLKPSRREGRDVLAEPVVPAACIFFRRRAMGAASSRPSLRPQRIRGRKMSMTRARMRRGKAKVYLVERDVAASSSVIPAKAGIQYAAAPRSTTTLSDYWIARLNRAMTTENLADDAGPRDGAPLTPRPPPPPAPAAARACSASAVLSTSRRSVPGCRPRTR